MAIILSFIRWAKEWWYNHFFFFVFFFSKFIVQNRDDLTFFTVQTVNAVTPCHHVKCCNKIDCTDCIWLILNSRWSILYCAGKFDVCILPKMAKTVAKMAKNDSILFIIEKHRGLIISLTATITNFDCRGSTQTLYISKKWIVGIILIIITGGREVIF